MSLSTEQQMLIEQRVSNEAKSAGLAYVLWFFLGGFGVHRFYLGDKSGGIWILFLVWGGLALTAGGLVPAIVLVLIGGLMLLVDLFRIPGMADRHKQKVRDNLTAAALSVSPKI